jgi:hypothetical protein
MSSATVYSPYIPCAYLIKFGLSERGRSLFGRNPQTLVVRFVNTAQVATTIHFFVVLSCWPHCMVGVVALIYRFCSSRKYVIHQVTAGELFTISTYTSVFYFQFRWVTATVVLCGLFLQGCKSGVHAIIEEAETQPTHKIEDHECSSSRVLAAVSGTHTQSSSLSCEYSDAHSQLVLAASPPSEPLILCPPSAAVLAPGIAQILASPARATGMPHVQFSSKFFTTSSGERVSFRKEGSKWQAILQPGTGSCIYQRALPVVSAEAIETLLKNLHGQDIWASRSRIHIMATAHPAHTPFCVYLGKCGLLGGMPVQRGLLPAFESVWLAADSNPYAQAVGSAEEPSVSLLPLRTPVPSQAFGAKKWKQYFGEVGIAPPLPGDISEILSRPCPFWPEQQVKDTHLLVLVPSTINGRPFTLNLLNELIRSPKSGNHSTKYDYYDNEIARVFGNQASDSSYWILMTRDVLPGSKTKTHASQQALIAEYAYSKGILYEMPHVLEAATVILSHFACTGERLHTDNPWTFTRCQELLDVKSEVYSLFVGGFASGGLDLDYADGVHSFCDGQGVSCLRNFMKEERLRQEPIPPQTFGAEAWNRYFGEVGVEPPLPVNINQILNHTCPFWPDKTVQNTHLLILIPSTVDGKPFTLNLLERLIRSPKGAGHRADFRSYHYAIRRLLGHLTPRSSHWVLMTRDVLPNSRMQTYATQRALFDSHEYHQQLFYDMPNILEAVTAMLLHHVRTGERLYTDDPGTSTRCKEQIVYENDNHPVVVGDFSSEGLDISLNHHIDYSHCYGVSCLRRF